MISMEEYFKPLPPLKKRPKVQRFSIPGECDYEKINNFNYTIVQLKDICKYYKIRIKSGVKKNVINKICYNMMMFKHVTTNIQKNYRGYMSRTFHKTLGPAIYNRSQCNNLDDFVTTENMDEISYYYFISYLDKDNFVYGFNLSSLYNLFKHKDYKNPYTRNLFSKTFINTVEKRLRLNNVYRKYDLIQKNNKQDFSIQSKTVELFQKMDSLGFYTQMEWMYKLNIHKLILFFRELYDIWNYRAQLTPETKRSICPPNGNPFSDINIRAIYNNQYSEDTNYNNIYKILLRVIERLICTGNQVIDNQYMGASYVLSALTLVNQGAANSLPWLYESVAHIG